MRRDPDFAEEDVSLDIWSSWADRQRAPATRPWHFIDIRIDGGTIDQACGANARTAHSAIANGQPVELATTKMSEAPASRTEKTASQADPTPASSLEAPTPETSAPAETEGAPNSATSADNPTGQVSSSETGQRVETSEAKPDEPPQRIWVSQDLSRFCLTDKIQDFVVELSDPELPEAERIVALKYLIHLIGDVHQPLHTADNEDAGGNCVAIGIVDGVNGMSLHSYWDTVVVRQMGPSPEDIAKTLGERISNDNSLAWTTGVSAQDWSPTNGWVRNWTLETHALAKSVAYSGPTRATCGSRISALPLDQAYQDRARATAETQLQKAGVRLAAILNAILDPDTTRRQNVGGPLEGGPE